MKPVFLILVCALLPACNLVRGVGQDMAAVGRTLAKVSGTESEQQHEETAPAAQPFDQSYEDQSYLAPAEPPQ